MTTACVKEITYQGPCHLAFKAAITNIYDIAFSANIKVYFLYLPLCQG